MKRDRLFLRLGVAFVTAVAVLGVCFYPSFNRKAPLGYEEKAITEIDALSQRTARDEEKSLIPCGTPFGIKMLTDGAVVVGISSPYESSPKGKGASYAGIKPGDVIVSYGGRKVLSNEDVKEITQKSRGRELPVVIKRDGEEIKLSLTPYYSEEERQFKAGMWLRDSSAGIGMLTFYDPETNSFGGLGHAICDEDTARLMPLSRGQIVRANIIGVNKGNKNGVGELRGVFLGDGAIGIMEKNTPQGVFGKLDKNALQKVTLGKSPMKICKKEDVKRGEAMVITTVSGQLPMAYRARICSVSDTDNKTKNMVVEITDSELLQRTGGIVQGMSGSPIIQDGKLVGAVTHVFVGDQTKGYGIFIENMLETAG